MSADRNEQGAVTAFVVILTFAMLLVAGLVVDGGYMLTSRREAMRTAEAAARAGAQAVADPSNGTLDPAAAMQMAHAYLRSSDHTGLVLVDGPVIRVEVQFDEPMRILGAGGLRSVTVKGFGEARGARGVLQEGDL